MPESLKNSKVKYSISKTQNTKSTFLTHFLYRIKLYKKPFQYNWWRRKNPTSLRLVGENSYFISQNILLKNVFIIKHFQIKKNILLDSLI